MRVSHEPEPDPDPRWRQSFADDLRRRRALERELLEIRVSEARRRVRARRIAGYLAIAAILAVLLLAVFA